MLNRDDTIADKINQYIASCSRLYEIIGFDLVNIMHYLITTTVFFFFLAQNNYSLTIWFCSQMANPVQFANQIREEMWYNNFQSIKLLLMSLSHRKIAKWVFPSNCWTFLKLIMFFFKKKKKIGGKNKYENILFNLFI